MDICNKILKEIKCATEIDVIRFEYDYSKFGKSEYYEEYFKIRGNKGEYITGRIANVSGARKSKIDYYYNVNFDRNVNLWEEV